MAPESCTRAADSNYLPGREDLKERSKLRAADEQFDVDDEELERTLSLGTAEKLRDADVPAMQSLLDLQDNYLSPSMSTCPCPMNTLTATLK